MVTLSMILVFGMLGLVVDLGWGFFVKSSAQSAADAAALAAVRKAYSIIGQQEATPAVQISTAKPLLFPAPTLRTAAICTADVSMRQQNFNIRPSSQRNLMMRSGTNSPFTTATGNVAVKYWVTATVAGQIPQLFSAVLGNTTLTSSARATAAVVTQVVDGSLILLNRRRDRTVFGNTDYYGVNLLVQANDNGSNYALQTSGSIRLASTCAGTSLGNGDCQAGNKPAYAGVNQGGGTVYAPSTTIAGSGSYNDSNGSPLDPNTLQWRRGTR